MQWHVLALIELSTKRSLHHEVFEIIQVCDLPRAIQSFGANPLPAAESSHPKLAVQSSAGYENSFHTVIFDLSADEWRLSIIDKCKGRPSHVARTKKACLRNLAFVLRGPFVFTELICPAVAGGSDSGLAVVQDAPLLV